MKEDINFNKRLYELRKNLGLTQVDFAELTGLTQVSISHYENGGVPNVESLLLISEKCNVSIDWLLTGRNPTKKDEKIMNDFKNSELENLCQKYLSLSDDYRDLVQKNISAYLKAEKG